MFILNGETQTEIISKQLADHSSTGEEQTAFLTTIIAEFECSEKRKTMAVAQQYYENKNDIKDAKRMVIGRDPETNAAILMESTVLTNNKLSHNFMKKLTRQKIGYMLGSPFTFQSNRQDDAEAKAFFLELKNYFDRGFFKMVKNVGRDSIIKTLGWILVYYDEKGDLKFKRIAPEEVIPFWKDSDHTELDAVIRRYIVEQYIAGEKKEVKYVDYYTSDGIYHYKTEPDGRLWPFSEGFKETNFSLKRKNPDTNADEVTGILWANIPFIPFKYDPDEMGLLSKIKTLVDDYDKKTSSVANNIDDFPNSMLVIKNYDGQSKEEFVANKNQYRTLFVQGEGDAKALETPLNVTDVEKHLERLRDDVYEFGQGVDTAKKDMKDPSGVALRFMYADLDMDCLDWGSETQWSLMQLIWFIQQDILYKKKIDYSAVDYNIIFNTDIIVNESETILNCSMSVGVISDKTIAANHPWTIDADKEIADKMAEDEEELALSTDYAIKENKAKPAPVVTKPAPVATKK